MRVLLFASLCLSACSMSPPVATPSTGVDATRSSEALVAADDTGDFTRPFGFSHFGRSRFEDTDDDGLPDKRVPEFESPSRRAPVLPGSASRQMIYNAAFRLQVASVEDSIRRATQSAVDAGGYLAGRHNHSITLRVPKDRFQAFLADLPELGQVLAQQLKAEDVTAEYRDLGIRIDNAAQTRKRLLALLDKASKMEDILKIEEALARVTAELESMKGQLKLLSDRIAFSTLELAFVGPAAAPPRPGRRLPSRFPWINGIGLHEDLRRF